MTNDVELNAEFDLHHNQNDKELWFYCESQYGRLQYNSDFQAERQDNVRAISIKHHLYVIKPR